MALTRAQLLSGNSSQGAVLSNQVQGVTAGAGVQISGTGALSINSSDPTFNGFIKTNNTSAYNGYVWPGSDGTAGFQLTTDGAGNLTWADADSIPWTAKGQLVVGTGAATQTLLSVGTNTSFPVADSTATSGLVYTSALKSAVLLPVGNATTERPTVPVVGQVRYNNVANEFEGYSGASPVWQPLGGQPTGGGNDKIFFTNSQVVTTNYTLPTGKNAMTAGPVTVNAGVTVTVPAGAAWSVV
jgi:hypothetical protein